MPSILRYGLAVALILAALGVNYAASAVLGQPAPLIALLLAVIFAAMFGGPGPGVLATVLGALVGAAFFIQPVGFLPMAPVDVLRAIVFVAAGLLTSGLAGSRYSALMRWKSAASDLRDSESRARSVVDHVAEGIVTIDEHGSIVSANPAAERLFGYAEEELVGRNVSLLMPEPYRSEHDEYLRRYLAGAPARIIGVGREVVAMRKGGGTFPIELAVSEFLIGERRYFTGIVRDISDRRRAEEEVASSRKRLQSVADYVPALISYVDRDGRYLFANAAYEDWFGRPKDQVIGRLAADVVGEATFEGRRAYFERALRGETVRFEDCAVHSRLGERMIEVAYVPDVGTDDEVAGLYVLGVDITERHRAEEALRRAHGLIEGITHGTEDLIAAMDPELRYLYFNDAYKREFERLWGLEIETGTSVKEALAAWPDERRKAEALWSRALAGETFRITTELGPSAAQSQVYDLRFNPVHDRHGRLLGAAHILRNVTEWVRMRESLRRSEESLREENRRKNEFLAVLGHELRNPLAPLRTAVDLLELQATPEQLAKVRTIMDRQVDHLTRLVDDLLDLSRISRGKITLRRTLLDLNRVIDAAVELARPRIDARRHRLADERSPVPLSVDGDLQRLTQVVANLLHNAAKYTEPGGTIELRTQALNGHATVHVRDTGFGIPPDQLERVFEMFSQVPEHRATRGGGDLGIGLAVARRIAALHGGSVRAYSDGIGSGSEFVLTLPLRDAGPEAPAAESREAALERDARRVLVVDDNVDAAESLTMLLGSKGHDVLALHDGPSALDVIESFAPDVVLLDIGLPGMDGYEVARHIRARPGGGRLVLFAITGWGQHEDKRRAREAGFDEHLTKPVNGSLLAALISAESPKDTAE